MERILWFCTAPGVELLLPTRAEEAEVAEQAAEERRRTSPVGGAAPDSRR